jgi:hypothetical protein
MPLTVWDHLLSGLSHFFEVVLLVLLIRNGWYLRVPIFTAYLAVVLACGVLRWGIYLSLGYSSWAGWYVAWITQAVLLLARSLVVVELCWNTLRPYQGIWALTWRLLLVITVLLAINAALDARGDAHWVVPFVLTAERGLELAVAVLLLSLLFITGYYGIPMQPPHRLIALGLCFYSTVQVLNDSLMRGWLPQYIAWWNGIHIVSFQVVLAVWCAALWKHMPATESSPHLLSEHAYQEMTSAVNFRLRMLNERLLEILKS